MMPHVYCLQGKDNLVRIFGLPDSYAFSLSITKPTLALNTYDCCGNESACSTLMPVQFKDTDKISYLTDGSMPSPDAADSLK